MGLNQYNLYHPLIVRLNECMNKITYTKFMNTKTILKYTIFILILSIIHAIIMKSLTLSLLVLLNLVYFIYRHKYMCENSHYSAAVKFINSKEFATVDINQDRVLDMLLPLQDYIGQLEDFRTVYVHLQYGIIFILSCNIGFNILSFLSMYLTAKYGY